MSMRKVIIHEDTMTNEQEEELLEAAKRIADSLDYLNRAIKTLAGKHLNTPLPDVPSASHPRR